MAGVLIFWSIVWLIIGALTIVTGTTDKQAILGAIFLSNSMTFLAVGMALGSLKEKK